ncbi:MAG: lytic polysaccharide monooxygenase [Gammaproteobacteria bacterium]|nr:lytic polysaccharide monooxygenase [Gammaproteobacteria bacterium]
MLRITLCSVTLLIVLLPLENKALAHGSMAVPESRVYNCYRNNPENPTDPACAAAKAVAGTQAFYDWNGINQANANSNHQAVVPDGQLCAGGQRKFAGLNLARSDWQPTPISPKRDGTFDFEFYATAPHATKDWIFFVTRSGYEGTSPLRWNDLTEFCRLGSVPLHQANRYILNCPLPNLTGKHVIYTVWQRSDSTEAFYTCTDVVLGTGANNPWLKKAPLRARNNFSEGSKIVLRLFNHNGNDIETVQHTVTAGFTSAEDWAFDFAKTVNTHSKYARIGILNFSDGSITPIHSAKANYVYVQAGMNISYEIDIEFSASP